MRMDPDDHAGKVVPQGILRRELTGAITWCKVLQRTLASLKLASGNNFLMGYHNGLNSHVSFVSDTALSAASSGLRFKKKKLKTVIMLISMYETFKNREKLINKILQPRQEVQSILYCTEKWLKWHWMRSIRKNSPGQVEWNGGRTFLFLFKQM